MQRCWLTPVDTDWHVAASPLSRQSLGVLPLALPPRLACAARRELLGPAPRSRSYTLKQGPRSEGAATLRASLGRQPQCSGSIHLAALSPPGAQGPQAVGGGVGGAARAGGVAERGGPVVEHGRAAAGDPGAAAVRRSALSRAQGGLTLYTTPHNLTI